MTHNISKKWWMFGVSSLQKRVSFLNQSNDLITSSITSWFGISFALIIPYLFVTQYRLISPVGGGDDFLYQKSAVKNFYSPAKLNDIGVIRKSFFKVLISFLKCVLFCQHQSSKVDKIVFKITKLLTQFKDVYNVSKSPELQNDKDSLKTIRVKTQQNFL